MSKTPPLGTMTHKFKIVIELEETKELLRSHAYALDDLIKISPDEIQADLMVLAFDEEQDKDRKYSVREEIQFTGMQDKNNSDIYETDEVKNRIGIGYVTYRKAEFCVKFTSGEYFELYSGNEEQMYLPLSYVLDAVDDVEIINKY